MLIWHHVSKNTCKGFTYFFVMGLSAFFFAARFGNTIFIFTLLASPAFYCTFAPLNIKPVLLPVKS
jgi:hypothetical protein